MNANTVQVFASLMLALALSGNAGADEGHHDHHHHASSVQLASVAPLEQLAARYDLKVNKIRTDWYLWREADAIETANPIVGQNTIWERNDKGEYNYRRIFHKDKRVVEYVPGEIKTRHAEPDWTKLASVVSPLLLDELKRGSSKTLFGQKAVRYSGVAGGQKIDMWWLERTQLPARLSISSAGQQMFLDLKELHAKSPPSWPRANEELIAAYGQIDAADFGDMESDPFVARVMRQDGHTHAH